MDRKRIIIGGSRSGVGKTTVSLALMAAFNARDYRVQPFKVGPDYIDPGFHNLAAETLSYNLDSYFLQGPALKERFINKSETADISILEGVMGLFDGKGKEMTSSTAEIAKKLKAPVILVIDAAKMGQSGAALVYGYKNFDPDLNLKGVIINNVGSRRHYQILKEVLEADPVNVDLLGYLPRIEDLKLPERHLGLVPVHESQQLKSYFNRLQGLAEEYFDLDKIYEIASSGEDIIKPELPNSPEPEFTKIKVGVAYDQAFNFYYQSDLDLMEELGVELTYFSPLKAEKVPKVDALYFGGGFPESFLSELADNKSFKIDLNEKVLDGLPVYGECGGLMYLSNLVKDINGNAYQMAGLLDLEIEMTDKLQAMGYREIEALKDNLLLEEGQKAKGHLFHYSQVTKKADMIPLNYKIDQRREGYSFSDNLLASYLQINFAAQPEVLRRFLKKAENYKSLVQR